MANPYEVQFGVEGAAAMWTRPDTDLFEKFLERMVGEAMRFNRLTPVSRTCLPSLSCWLTFSHPLGG